jgi:hypothetical protein
MSIPEPILPQTHDRDTEGFFAAAREGRLAVRHCANCDNGLHPPTSRCFYCGSWNTDWKQVSGRGRLYSWTVIEHMIHPAYPAPTTIVVVELEDVKHVRLVGHIAGRPALEKDMPMRVCFETLDENIVQPNWEIAPVEAPAAEPGQGRTIIASEA